MNNNLARQGEYRSELIKGKIIMMSPSPITNHNRISRNITRIFDNYLDGKSCEVFADGLDVYLTAQDRFEPDCMVVCDPNKIKYNGVHGAPDLIVEVLSNLRPKLDSSNALSRIIPVASGLCKIHCKGRRVTTVISCAWK